MTEIILDPGSCHDGSLEKARRLVEIGADCGADKIKFQLLSENETKGGNVLLPWEWLPELMALGKDKGVEVFASVFNADGFAWVTECGCQSYKLSYAMSLKMKTMAWMGSQHFKAVYRSGDIMNPPPRPLITEKNLITLYCIPLYPVPYLIDFEGIFPRFDGFSSHCLGIEQEIRAVEAGANYLEFHFQGGWRSSCPDARFAKTPQLVERLVSRIKNG